MGDQTADLSTILVALGRIEGKVDNEIESSKSQRKTIFEKLDKVVENSAETREGLAVLRQRLDDHHMADERRFNDNEHDIKNNKLGMTALSAKVDGMELTAARKAGNVAIIGALSGFFTLVWNAVSKGWQ